MRCHRISTLLIDKPNLDRNRAILEQGVHDESSEELSEGRVDLWRYHWYLPWYYTTASPPSERSWSHPGYSPYNRGIFTCRYAGIKTNGPSEHRNLDWSSGRFN